MFTSAFDCYLAFIYFIWNGHFTYQVEGKKMRQCANEYLKKQKPNNYNASSINSNLKKLWRKRFKLWKREEKRNKRNFNSRCGRVREREIESRTKEIKSTSNNPNEKSTQCIWTRSDYYSMNSFQTSTKKCFSSSELLDTISSQICMFKMVAKNMFHFTIHITQSRE